MCKKTILLLLNTSEARPFAAHTLLECHTLPPWPYMYLVILNSMTHSMADKRSFAFEEVMRIHGCRERGRGGQWCSVNQPVIDYSHPVTPSCICTDCNSFCRKRTTQSFMASYDCSPPPSLPKLKLCMELCTDLMAFSLE